MEFKNIIDAFETKQNGSFISIDYTGELPVSAKAKKEGVVAYKVVRMVVRKGIAYANQKSVQEKVEAGKVLTHELPWGQWKEGYEGLAIEHKGVDYMRLYPTQKCESTYFVNGVEKTYEELKELGCILGSFFNKKNEPIDAMTIKCSNIVEIR